MSYSAHLCAVYVNLCCNIFSILERCVPAQLVFVTLFAISLINCHIDQNKKSTVGNEIC